MSEIGKILDTRKDDFNKFLRQCKGSTSASEMLTHKTTAGYLSPTILEERQLNVAQMSVFDRMILDRIIYFGNPFNEDTYNALIAQMLYLASISDEPIKLYINSPGGSVMDGLAVIDTMNFIRPEVHTLCVGMAASMGAVVLSNGEKGNRFALPHSRVMIHQISSQHKGTYSDLKIEFELTQELRKDLYNILAKNMEISFEEVERLCDRDNWLRAEEAVDLKIIDNILKKE